MDDFRLDRLRALAEAATPGPWDVRRTYSEEQGVIDPLNYRAPGYYDNPGIFAPNSREWPVACGEYYVFRNGRDAAYIAAANPQTMLALLDRVDELERTAAAAGRALREAQRDAERYRVWRDDYTSTMDDPSELQVALCHAWEPHQVDEAIDAAIAAKEQSND